VKWQEEGLPNVCSASSVIRMMRWSGHVARIREKRNACRLLVGKPEETSGLGSPRDG
jgi:hypothetical protein